MKDVCRPSNNNNSEIKIFTIKNYQIMNRNPSKPYNINTDLKQ